MEATAIKLVEITRTSIWIECDLLGARHVVMHHEGFGDPFTYATFHYNYAYTSNGGTWDAAHRLALALGATEPVEQRQRDFHTPTAEELREEIALMQEALAAPPHFDRTRRVVTLLSTKTTGRVQVPVTRAAAKLLDRPPFTVTANEASTLFAKLCRQLLIAGLTFHDSRATALTLLAKRVDVLTLAKISRHKDLSLLMNVYYLESAEEIAARI